MRLARRGERLYRPVCLGLTLLALSWWGVAMLAAVNGAAARGELGWDARLYADIGRRFLDTGQPYAPYQLTGPYQGEGAANLYPPLALYLFVPFSVIPLALWWAIPLAVLGLHVARCRPAPWAWPLMAALAGTVPAIAALVYGNTILWSAAFVALGFRWSVAAALLAYKPTDIIAWPLFVRRRAFWIGVGVVAVAALPFGALWADWITALDNLADSSPLRNINGLAVLAVPVVAWVGRSHPHFDRDLDRDVASSQGIGHVA